MKTPIRPRGRTLAVLLLLILTAGVAPAYAAGSTNTYDTDLPYVTVGPVPFTVSVEGPNLVCEMRFGDQVLTAAPWTFQYSPALDKDWGLPGVNITECNGSRRAITVRTTRPYLLSYRLVPASEKKTATINIVNLVEEDATAVITNAKGAVVKTARISGHQQVTFPVTSSSPTQTMRVTVTSTTNPAMTNTLTFTVSNRWQTMFSGWHPAMFNPCATLTWVYDPTGAPSTAKPAAVRADIKGAQNRISAVTGLTFVESTDRSLIGKPNVIVYNWAYPGADSDAAAIGGPETQAKWVNTAWQRFSTGMVNLNKRNWLTKSDVNRGFGLVAKNRSSGRGWVFVHETLHVLGLSHSIDPKQIMAPRGSARIKLGDADLAGLRYLYPSAGCSPVAQN